jgi:hypothetical protein
MRDQCVNGVNRQKDALFLQCLRWQQEKMHRSLSAFLLTLSENSSRSLIAKPEASRKSARFSYESGQSSTARRERNSFSDSLIGGRQEIEPTSLLRKRGNSECHLSSTSRKVSFEVLTEPQDKKDKLERVIPALSLKSGRGNEIHLFMAVAIAVKGKRVIKAT